MIFRLSRPTDFSEIKTLWKSCFYDEEEYINRFFQSFCIENGVLAFDGDTLCAMAFWIPAPYVQPNGEMQQGAYLYALCTAPSHRNRGLCRRACAFTEQELRKQGYDFVFLHPAEQGLQEMYEKLGYHMTLTLQETTVFAQPLQGVFACSLTADAYAQYRQCLLQNSFIDWQLPAIRHQAALGDLLLLTKENEMAIAAIEKNGNQVYIKECLGASGLAAVLPARYEAAVAVCRSTGTTPFAMTKALSGKSLPTGYMGFAFD